MKKLILILGVLTCIVSYSEEKSNVTEAVSSVVSGAVSTGKNFLKGVKDGVDTGRKEGGSLDEAVIIYDKEGFEKYIKGSVLSVTKEGTEYKVTVGLKNDTEQMMRLTNLHEQKSLQLLDVDGFAVFSSGPFGDINIPGKAAIKSTFRFPADGKPGMLKIYESEIKITDDMIKVNE
ncbi:hypothetical protein [Fusobacterium sp.]|uniref:hypothetical protein n=1 Tax=Fusobacterium sp. TaxID=68766 RepID=UPI0029048E82|nr:hypothetical protein [Fusobacterium sp.]MDU1911782.1 hypothetical protein [Fusobacterium sp.]